MPLLLDIGCNWIKYIYDITLMYTFSLLRVWYLRCLLCTSMCVTEGGISPCPSALIVPCECPPPQSNTSTSKRLGDQSLLLLYNRVKILECHINNPFTEGVIGSTLCFRGLFGWLTQCHINSYYFKKKIWQNLYLIFL